MPFIETIAREDATGQLATLYDRVGNPDGSIDNVMLVHSLSPASLKAHFELYVTAMHKRSPLSRVEREMVGAYVSKLNHCEYCLTHHCAGLDRLLKGERPEAPRAILESAAPAIARDELVFSERERAMFTYAGKLTQTPGKIAQDDVQALRAVGLDDRAILDLAQVVAYFCFANRIALGLGAEIENFPIGQHPAQSD